MKWRPVIGMISVMIFLYVIFAMCFGSWKPCQWEAAAKWLWVFVEGAASMGAVIVGMPEHFLSNEPAPPNESHCNYDDTM